MKIMLDSHQSPFSERYKAILIKAGVEVEDFCVPPLRYEPFLVYCKQIIKSKAMLLHFLWAFNQPPVLVAPRLLGKKVILHWIGSDVAMALNRHRTPWAALGSRHLATDMSLSQELQRLKIEAGVIRAPCDFPEVVPPWPTEYTVLTYLPPNRGFLYGPQEVMQLAVELPWATFLVVANDGESMPVLPNIKYLGWLNKEQMDTVYARCRVILRLTKHDAGGATAMEALSRGRYVVWTKAYPFCEFADVRDMKRVAMILCECLRREGPNLGAREHVLADFDQDKIAKELLGVYGY